MEDALRRYDAPFAEDEPTAGGIIVLNGFLDLVFVFGLAGNDLWRASTPAKDIGHLPARVHSEAEFHSAVLAAKSLLHSINGPVLVQSQPCTAYSAVLVAALSLWIPFLPIDPGASDRPRTRGFREL